MESFSEQLKASGIKWNDFRLQFNHEGVVPRRPKYDLNADQFLLFAKEDVSNKTIRDRVNAISNAKRAIDCKIDEILEIYGVDFKTNESPIKKFTANFDTTDYSNFKLDIIAAMNFAPKNLIGKTRSLRNRLEHKYELPEGNQVTDGIEIGELFINNLESKVKLIETDLFISNPDDDERGIRISLNVEKKHFSFHKIEPLKSRIIQIELSESQNSPRITPDEISYYSLIGILNSRNDPGYLKKALSIMLNSVGIQIPAQHLNFTVNTAY